jgi:hypothetical protein
MSNAPIQADMTHPVVQMAERVSRSGQEVGSDETYVIDDAGAQKLVACILAHAHDPTIASGVLGLFGLAAALKTSYNSPSAAAAIICAIGEAKPALGSLIVRPKRRGFVLS